MEKPSGGSIRKLGDAPNRLTVFACATRCSAPPLKPREATAQTHTPSMARDAGGSPFSPQKPPALQRLVRASAGLMIRKRRIFLLLEFYIGYSCT